MRLEDDGKLAIFGETDDAALAQIRACLADESAVAGVLCADNHLGYSMPVGGVVAYRGKVSPVGVGYDIGCGNMAVRTPLALADVRPDLPKIMDRVAREISFGIGRSNPKPVDHPLFDDDAWDSVPHLAGLKDKARAQLGTVGSGNHFVDLLVEPETDRVWVANHFGSRGLGWTIANGFLNLAENLGFDERSRGESVMQAPVLLALESEIGLDYWTAMELAGRYAYAGREFVVRQVLNLLGTHADFEVHNNHNFAWEEEHFGERLVVVRKGATPAAPGQFGFVGGNMCDASAIVRGVESPASARALRSTIHGAGRVMSRARAKGKWRRERDAATGRKRMVQVREGEVSRAMMDAAVKRAGIELRGGGLDETPFCYKKLDDVLAAHAGSIEIVHRLLPIGVAMAGESEFDPYKD